MEWQSQPLNSDIDVHVNLLSKWTKD